MILVIFSAIVLVVNTIGVLTLIGWESVKFIQVNITCTTLTMNLTVFDGFYNDFVNILIFFSESVVHNETIFLRGNQNASTGQIMFQKVGTYYLSILEIKDSFNDIGLYSPLYVTAGSDSLFINLIAIPSTVSAYEQFQLQCKLTDRFGKPVIGKALSVSSTNLKLYGAFTVFASDSSVNFSLYTDVAGYFQLNVTGSSEIGTTSINFLPNLIKFIYISSNVFIIWVIKTKSVLGC